MSGLTFHETMSGLVALAETDPEAGAASPAAAELAIHCEITIDASTASLDDPEHRARWPEPSTTRRSVAGSLSPTASSTYSRPGSGKIMEYRLGFDHGGTAYYLVGKKHVHDVPASTWKDTTTLFTVVREGSDEAARSSGAGVLSLGVEALARMMSTMRPHGGGSSRWSSSAGSLGSLWEAYGADEAGTGLG
jgi:hypothetical protein